MWNLADPMAVATNILENHGPDQMEEWIEAEACDGFVIAATHSPGAYEDMVRLVVPELQRRGIFRTEYEGATLRENLGLKVPENRYARAARLKEAS